MSRVNLSPLQVRKRAIQNCNQFINRYGAPLRPIPSWVDVIADIPPAQIMVRQQPSKHPVTQIRTRSIPNSTRTEQYAKLAGPPRKSKKSKPSKLFAPIEIRYEEDQLRRQFFSDHPWELARPRIVLETDGNQYKDADWSKGIKQPGIPICGESVIQRQLWLLQNVPDMDVPSSYDVARREFYMLRRAEETRRRIAVEEAEHMGAYFQMTQNRRALLVEDLTYNDWEKWSREQAMEMIQRSSANDVGQPMAAEEQALMEIDSSSDQTQGGNNSRIQRPGSSNLFAAEAQRKSQFRMA